MASPAQSRALEQCASLSARVCLQLPSFHPGLAHICCLSALYTAFEIVTEHRDVCANCTPVCGVHVPQVSKTVCALQSAI